MVHASTRRGTAITAGGFVEESVVVTIEGDTREALAALRGVPHVLPRFPYRIGRRGSPGDPLSDNDLALPDRVPYNVSRSHCAIGRAGGTAFVIDRGSRLGTLVGRDMIGNAHGVSRVDLPPGTTVIALGGPLTPFRFRVTVRAVS
ncbi:MAG TPA: FHA domain-containing protein [Terriglobales bacterium]|nr:FHA domain-containing protein [Terriglobales bacterium]